MRSYANSLLMEDILPYIDAESPGTYSVVNSLLRPRIKIVEEDCGTLLGKVVDLKSTSEGLIELENEDPLTKARINELLSKGIYQVRTRDLGKCTSKGGVCRKCYASSPIYRFDTATVGSVKKLNDEYVFSTITLKGQSLSFRLGKTPTDYSRVIVFKNNQLVDSSTYSIFNDKITFESALLPLENYVVFFVKDTNNLLLNYVSETYSGSLLGLSPLLDSYLPVPLTVLRDQLSEEMITYMRLEVEGLPQAPESFLKYSETIPDKLEKALFLIYLHAIYFGTQ